ncbi:MAG TPA: hypothetical protein VL181_03515 [Holophagaceae bacterium]|jgi:opacity protein-like surface antigen|nr:hypothetical protein [Holophagaceae bacterium]
MNKTTILSLALLALPAFAQEQHVSLIFDQTKHEDTTFSSGGSSATVSVDKTTAVGLRYGIAAAHFWNGALDVEGTIRPRSNEKYFKINGVEESPANAGGSSIKMSDEYLSLGVGMRWTQVVDFGFMLEDRQEASILALDTGAGFSYTQRASVNRPWLRLHAGYTFPIEAAVKPFVNIGYGFALAKKGTDTAGLNAINGAGSTGQEAAIDFLSRSVLPKSELSIEAGIRF